MRYLNITEALNTERPNDKIIKVLSNKFAIVNVMADNGKFDGSYSIAGLDNGKILFYGNPYKNNLQDFNRWINSMLESLSNTSPILYQYYTHSLVKVLDQRRYKQVYRKLAKQLDNNKNLELTLILTT